MNPLFEYIVLSLILLSLTSYLNISIRQSTKALPLSKMNRTFICTAIHIVVYATIILLRCVLFYDNITPLNAYPNNMFPQLLVICIFMTLAALTFWNRKRQIPFTKRTLLILCLVLIAGCATPITAFKHIYYALVLAFTLHVIYFVTCYRRDINDGIHFIIAGTVALLIALTLSIRIDVHFFNVLSLALLCFIMFGFFIYYAVHYVNRLEYQNLLLKRRDRIIRLKNKRIETLAFFDDITLLPSRVSLEKDLTHTVSPAYFCLMDLKQFMSYNNLLGYKRGNQLLKNIALCINEGTPENVSVYRLYSDKFVIGFSDYTKDAVIACVQSLIESLKTTNADHFITEAHFGIAFFEPQSPDGHVCAFDTLLNELEIATLIAKKNHQAFHLFSKGDQDLYLRSLHIEVMLRHAIEAQAFELVYQPQVNGSTYDIDAYEALLRWKLDDEYISPSEFIPIAERMGMMLDITKYVVTQVFKDIHSVSTFRDKRIAINLSAEQLVNEAFVDFVTPLMKSEHVNPKNIVFEITETALFNDIQKVKHIITRLKNSGFQISLDDFGIGYSSFYRFSAIDIDEVKFDKVFIDDIANPKTYMTVKKTAELFKSFNMRVVIEGIETKSQLDALSDIPIDSLQGFYFYKPMPKEKSVAHLNH